MAKKIIVLGGGESGVGAALLAKHKGYEVFLSEAGQLKAEQKTLLAHFGIPYEEGGHNLAKIYTADEVIKSPGIPNELPVVQGIVARGIPLLSEIEFAARFTRGKLLAITGSNGKTTTTLLLHHLLTHAGFDVGLGGNVGHSFARRLVEEGDHDYWVLELSSFQLEHCYDFHPYVAILTGLSPDHLDRYGGSYEAYAEAKMRIFRNQTAADYLIFNYESKDLRFAMAKHRIEAVRIPVAYTKKENLPFGAWATAAGLTMELPDLPPALIEWTHLKLSGKHNLTNALAALAAAMLVGASPEKLKEGLASFGGVPHRMELIAEIQGVRFINDSKATNVESVFFALEAFPASPHIIWIAGGVDKGNDYSMLDELVCGRVKHLICLGIDNAKLRAHYESKVKCSEARSMEEAITLAASIAQPGDVVLLSPACASFDLFKNYEDRGEQFRRCVQLLKPLHSKA